MTSLERQKYERLRDLLQAAIDGKLMWFNKDKKWVGVSWDMVEVHLQYLPKEPQNYKVAYE